MVNRHNDRYYIWFEKNAAAGVKAVLRGLRMKAYKEYCAKMSLESIAYLNEASA